MHTIVFCDIQKSTEDGVVPGSSGLVSVFSCVILFELGAKNIKLHNLVP